MSPSSGTGTIIRQRSLPITSDSPWRESALISSQFSALAGGATG
jgi:hypothetical protein